MRDEQFTIRDVANLLGLSIYDDKGYEAYVKCPFCGKKGHKASICIEKDGRRIDGFNCFSCGSKGNLYTLYADYHGIQSDGKHSRFQLARWRILKELKGESRFFGSSSSKYKYKAQPYVSTTEVVEKRSDEDLDKVYSALMKELKLKKEHQKNLEKRGLTNEQANLFFRSVPDRQDEAIVYCNRLLKAGYNLKSIPGFYKDKYNNWTFRTDIKGYLVPSANLNGQIVGFQIRLDKPIGKSKYVWFASPGRTGGSGSGSPCGFYGNVKANQIYYVDGVLKALVCNLLYKGNDVLFVGPGGVGQTRSIEDSIREIKKRGYKGRTIVNAFDMDEFLDISCDEKYDEKCKNCEFKGNCISCERKENKVSTLVLASKKLEKMAKDKGFRYQRSKWGVDKYTNTWNGDIKGLDDYLLET